MLGIFFLHNILFVCNVLLSFALIMTREDFFKIIPARPFFKNYCPEVKNYYHKVRRFDGNGKPLEFSEADKAAINAAINKIFKAAVKVKF
jgi:hypothetical protein